MESRIDELEAKICLAEELLDELNRTVFRQQEQIDLLQQQLRMIRQEHQVSAPTEFRDIREEIPPHY